jgi:hypothetical protein
MILEDFLNKYPSEKTRGTYKTALKSYFRNLYGSVNVSKAADKYFSEDRDYQKDLETFFQSISNKPPKTVRTF